MPLEPVGLDRLEFRAALGAFASSVIVLTVWDHDEPLGMTATAFCSVSVDPMMVLVCVNRSTKTFAVINQTNRFGVNILSSAAREVAQRCSKNGHNKAIESSALSVSHEWRAPAMAGAIAFLDCSVDTVRPVGTHAVFIGAVESIGRAERNDDDPLLYFRGSYRQLREYPILTHSGALPVVEREFA